MVFVTIMTLDIKVMDRRLNLAVFYQLAEHIVIVMREWFAFSCPMYKNMWIMPEKLQYYS